MTNDEARRYFENLYALPYEKAYERLRNDAPGLDRSDLLPLLLLAPYIPERLPTGSVSEKNHATAAEALLGQSLLLMGLDTFVIKRHDDCPDVAAVSPLHGYSLIADAKCMRLSRPSILVKDLKVSTVDSWRMFFTLRPESAAARLHFVQMEDTPEGCDFHEGPLNGLYRPSGLTKDIPQGRDERQPNAGLLVLPFRNLPTVRSRIYTECCAWDVTLLPWEHVYALTALGVTETAGLSLDDVWHMSFAIRTGQSKSEWRLGHMAKEDRLIAEVIGRRTGQLRDQIAMALEAMLARADEEVASLGDPAAVQERLDELWHKRPRTKQVKDEIKRLMDFDDLLDRVSGSKRFAEAWLAKRSSRPK